MAWVAWVALCFLVFLTHVFFCLPDFFLQLFSGLCAAASSMGPKSVARAPPLKGQHQRLARRGASDNQRAGECVKAVGIHAVVLRNRLSTAVEASHQAGAESPSSVVVLLGLGLHLRVDVAPSEDTAHRLASPRSLHHAPRWNRASRRCLPRREQGQALPVFLAQKTPGTSGWSLSQSASLVQSPHWLTKLALPAPGVGVHRRKADTVVRCSAGMGRAAAEIVLRVTRPLADDAPTLRTDVLRPALRRELARRPQRSSDAWVDQIASVERAETRAADAGGGGGVA